MISQPAGGEWVYIRVGYLLLAYKCYLVRYIIQIIHKIWLYFVKLVKYREQNVKQLKMEANNLPSGYTEYERTVHATSMNVLFKTEYFLHSKVDSIFC